MLEEISNLTSIARQLGARLFDYQQEKKFGAIKLQNMIFELSGNDQDMVSKEIWEGYFNKSKKHEKSIDQNK